MYQHLKYLLLAALSLLAVRAAVAAPPANDDFATAATISSLPYSNSVDTFEATSAAGDPGFCLTTDATVWYKFTPAVATGVQVETAGSNYDTTLQVFKGGSLDTLQLIGCSDDVIFNFQRDSKVVFEAAANATYYIVAGACCGQPGGLLQLSVKSVPTPIQFDIEVTLATSGTLNAVGAAVISGTITCSASVDDVHTFVTVTESIGRTRKISGSAHVHFGPCDGVVPFTRTVSSEGRQFSKGKVGVTMDVSAFGANGGDSDVAAEIVTLNRR